MTIHPDHDGCEWNGRCDTVAMEYCACSIVNEFLGIHSEKAVTCCNGVEEQAKVDVPEKQAKTPYQDRIFVFL